MPKFVAATYSVLVGLTIVLSHQDGSPWDSTGPGAAQVVTHASGTLQADGLGSAES